MTVREIINALLKYEPDEQCEIVENVGSYGEEVSYRLAIYYNWKGQLIVLFNTYFVRITYEKFIVFPLH